MLSMVSSRQRRLKQQVDHLGRAGIQIPLLPQGERRILRRDEVEAKTGFKRAHIYNLMKTGEFPQAMRIGVGAVGWDSVEIDQWIADRLNNRT